MAWPNTKIAPNSDKFGLVDPHRLLTWVWLTPKQAIPLIFIVNIVSIKMTCTKTVIPRTAVDINYKNATKTWDDLFSLLSIYTATIILIILDSFRY